jgi:catechol 2,3-dioxygenase-like lactoylglutathione lyase family enzyme
MPTLEAPAEQTQTNVQQAVPFFWVSNLEASLRFYVDGLGFKKTKEWIDQGKLRWCWLELGGASHMLQEYRPDTIPSNKRGEGVSICFQCKDAIAIYRDAITQGPETPTPLRRQQHVGSPSSRTPTVTNSTSKVPPTPRKSPSTKTQCEPASHN